METTFDAEKLVELEQFTTRGISDGYLPKLPIATPKFRKLEIDESIRKVVVDRLVHLQYLPRRSKVSNAKLTSAVKQLQRDAKLHVDGWLGYQTWQAIQQVFTFEEPTELENWLDDEQPTDFILRAAYVRLRALGVIEDVRINFETAAIKHKEQTRDIATVIEIEQLLRKSIVEQGLIQFRALLLSLDLKIRELAIGEYFHVPLLSLLFDQDKIVQLVHDRRVGLRKLLAAIPLNKSHLTYNEQTILSHALRFLGHVAKTELWLHGYYQGRGTDQGNVVISPNVKKIVITPALSRKRTKPSRKGHTQPFNIHSPGEIRLSGLLSLARDFVKEMPVVKNKMACLTLTSSELKRGIFNGQVTNTHVIIDIIVCAHAQEHELENSQERAEKIVKVISNKDNKIKDKHWKSSGFGNFLLDGAKRLWRLIKGVIDWAVNKIKKIVGKLSDSVLRIVRFAKQLAFKGLIIFERAGIAMSEGFSLLFNKVVPGSSSTLLMKRHLDMDFFVFVKNTTSSSQVSNFVESLKVKIKGFKFSVVIFNIIVKVIGIVKNLIIQPGYGAISLISTLLTLDSFIDEEDIHILKETLLTPEM